MALFGLTRPSTPPPPTLTTPSPIPPPPSRPCTVISVTTWGSIPTGSGPLSGMMSPSSTVVKSSRLSWRSRTSVSPPPPVPPHQCLLLTHSILPFTLFFFFPLFVLFVCLFVCFSWLRPCLQLRPRQLPPDSQRQARHRYLCPWLSRVLQQAVSVGWNLGGQHFPHLPGHLLLRHGRGQHHLDILLCLWHRLWQM